ncbi:hypothetical protein [Agrobacterium arsenijevicii]|uniref:Uncharacterized protein n=1 Tax=Agrobacterium arsenijevicii TaxID=1585697 RepID=A0ABR5D1L3_9HYPH|nr:hypothetical protein RP75_23520 [Agrobacterium arsenijevicii]
MARFSSSTPDLVLGKRFAKRLKEAEKELSAASTIRADEADAFNDRYGQEGKAPRYAEEAALHDLAGPEGKVGVMYQSFRKKIMYEPDQPDVMIRRKKKWWGKRAEQHVEDIPGSKDAEGNPLKYVSRYKLMRGNRTLIDSRYDVDGKLLKETVNLSNGRAKEQWDRDTKGRLIRTRFSTERLRDGILFSPVTETMSALKDGKRIVTQQKGQRVNTFDRDEATGKLTPTGRKGFFGEKSVSFKPDGSIATTHAKRGILYTEDVQYKGDRLKLVTTKRFLRTKKVIPVELTIGEMEQQRRLREAKQRATTENVRPAPPHQEMQDRSATSTTAPPPLLPRKPTSSVAAEHTLTNIPLPNPPPPIHRLGSRSPSSERDQTQPPVTKPLPDHWQAVPKLGERSKTSSGDVADNGKKALMESLSIPPATSNRSASNDGGRSTGDDKGKNALTESLAIPPATSSRSAGNDGRRSTGDVKGKNVEMGSLAPSAGTVSRFANRGSFERAYPSADNATIPRKPIPERARGEDYGR